MTDKWDTMAASRGSLTEPPAWVTSVIHGCDVEETREFDRLTSCTVRGDGGLVLVTVTVRNADHLDTLGFQRQTVLAYRAIALMLKQRTARYPIRFWNFIPDINKPISESLSRYMVFNAGRCSAFYEWYGDSSSFGRYVATASGVGHAGKDLVIHCLSANTLGTAVENPRQIASYRYSSQFGPLPPMFARATMVKLDSFDDSLLLVGGTSSIRGECSLHQGDPIQQTRETLHNLVAVIRAGGAAVGDDKLDQYPCDSVLLDQFRCLRVYHVRPSDRNVIGNLLANCFPNVEQIEWRHAHLCRPELLVEIEGVAHQPRVKSSSIAGIPPTRQRAALDA
jgi:chorismate lyase / 3-hydroxybenzoate synthase